MNIDFTQYPTITFSAFGKTALINTQNVQLSEPFGKFQIRPDSFKTVWTILKRWTVLKRSGQL